ncbi:MAG: hypothetical protein MJ224_02395 [archaeon]|nr:hypothetical protein [archaeon]
MALDENVLKFNEKGLLPPGCHEITLPEIKSIFVDGFPDSRTRQSRYECFLKMYKELLFNVKSCIRILIDGSFVTDKLNPYDVDFSIVIDSSRLSDEEYNYLNDIFNHKTILRREYDSFKNQVMQNKIDYNELYNLELYNYGCDFFPLYKLENNHKLYGEYCKERDKWVNFWGNTRENNPKGFCKL